MYSSKAFQFACISAYLARLSSADFVLSNVTATRGAPRPSASGSIIGTPHPKGQWISPEYTWFFEYPLPIAPIKSCKFSYTPTNNSAPIDFYEVDVKAFTQQIYPNLAATPMVGYDGQSPGPMFVAQQGRESVIRYNNDGPTNVSVHLHGSWSRAPFDGWASDYAVPGQYKDYYYPNSQNARTIWYHDHTEFATAENAYRGQDGLYLITDPQEQSLGLPKGDYDVTLGISAKVYNSDGTLSWNSSNIVGVWGDVIHVNGQPWPYFNVEPRKYRFRVLDASVSRTYDISLVPDGTLDNVSFDMIASDGGLFSHPVNTDNFAISMGERYEFVVDFANYTGQNITMKNARGMGEDVDYAATDMIMRFVVGDTVSDNTNNGPVPSHLRDVPTPPQKTEADKDFTFALTDGVWKINGVGFADVENRILSKPPRGATEIWTLHNGNGNGTHPVHIHLVDFQVLSRTGGRNTVLPYESAGMKDVVWLAGGETVTVAARYAPWDGVYMFHCHNLVHEDHDMLVAFNVTQLEHWGYGNDTRFIDPLEPEYRPKSQSSADETDDAIKSKLQWFYDSDAYAHGKGQDIVSLLDEYWVSGGTLSGEPTISGAAIPPPSSVTTGVVVMPTPSWSSSSGFAVETQSLNAQTSNMAGLY